ncbi:MAG: lysophospholipid acyltransferase family protein [Mariniphaga sp.]
MPGYYLLRSVTWIVSKMPLRLLYFFSDLMYYPIYYIFRYRRRVVAQNLFNSFPEKSKAELEVIAKKFYHHLCDLFIEMLYFDRMSVEFGKKCVKYKNLELPNSYLDSGRNVICLLGHYNNWEWFSLWTLYTNYKFYPVYKKLRSGSFDRFYYNLRCRFGAIPLERSDTFKQMYSDHQQKIPTGTAFLFDQTPRVSELHHWVEFLNQDTPVILGPEKVAQKLNSVVFFLHSRKITRGSYEIEIQLITDQAKNCPKFEIIDKGMKLLENQIKEQPEFWLWTHKRWKHSRTIDETSNLT